MKNKLIRLLKALSNETVKRIPYVILLLIILIFAQTVQANHTGNSLIKKVAQLSEDNKKLSQQNNQLLQQGVGTVKQIKLSSDQSVAINKCIGYTFATYTQTLSPVDFVNIDNCIIQNVQTPSTTEQPSAQRLSVNPVILPSFAQSTPQAKSKQSNSSHSKPNARKY
jgi:hypothetical protein